MPGVDARPLAAPDYRVAVPAPKITVSTVILRNAHGRLLTVRKRGTSAFMLPGGKPEAGESARDAAVREVREELGLELDPQTLRLVGTFEATAANEAGHRVSATVFEHPSQEKPHPAAEIEEIRWLDADVDPLPDALAPLLREGLLPALARGIRSVAVFTGARDGASPRYAELARALGSHLAAQGVTLVYGGGKVGLMGAVADAALSAGGAAVGVMPQHLVDREIAHPDLTELHVVGSMHERKQRMADLADAFIVLPGGAGTLEEFFEAWTWQQLGIHAKPIALLDGAYWGPLTAMLGHMVDEGFVRAADRDSLLVADTAEQALDHLGEWTPPAPKWR